MQKHVTFSLQFPHHGHPPVRLRLYETGERGMFRVKLGHAWLSASPCTPEDALRQAATLLRQALGLPVAETEPAPELAPGDLVTLPGELEHVPAGEIGKRGGIESVIWRVVTPPFETRTEGWCVVVGRGQVHRLTCRQVRCRDLRPAQRRS